MNFFQTLLNFSERAAKIARTIRQDPRLFALLVEEKGELEKNKRFCQDFKTLADVLIQESLRYYVGVKFPALANYVRGEESASFTNTLGEKIQVCICSSECDTATLLTKVLDGNVEVAKILAEVVHGDIEDVLIKEDLNAQFPTIKLENIGIWIDPIDSTSEYIHGNLGVADPISHIYSSGLPCVTVLVGVYDRLSGIPIIGIINQPFAVRDDTNARWMSRINWGLSYNNTLLHTISLPSQQQCPVRPLVVISSSETPNVQNELRKHFQVMPATGAGYKGLVVALGFAEAYFCSKASTYRWDTCAPHGILRSFGGGIISYKALTHLGQSQLLHVEELKKHQITYQDGNMDMSTGSHVWCNKDGVIVYRNPEILTRIYQSLKSPSTD